MRINFVKAPLMDRLAIKGVFRHALQYLDQPNHIIIAIRYMDKVEIQRLNNDTRGIDRTTDVLSYPTVELVAGDRVPEGACCVASKNIILGDIALCREVAVEQAQQYGHSVKREVCYLALHALLHCLGYDHMTEQDEQLMTSTADVIMNLAKVNR